VHGGKGQIADGGVRVPWICYWPGTIKPRRTTDALVDFSDLFPTILDVAGVSLPDRRKIDGHSFAPLLRGEPFQARQWVFYQVDGQYALREHRWKLDHTDTLFDMRYAPHREIPVDPSSDSEAKKALERLKAVVESLNPSQSAPRRRQ
jgi:arylsulfatase A-like enzyme